MGKLLNALGEFLKTNGWAGLAFDDHTLRLMHQGEHGSYLCIAEEIEDQKVLLFYSYAPVTVPQAKRPAAAGYLMHVNYQLAVGNFELNMDNGSARFRTSVRVDSGRLTAALAKPLVYVNLNAIDTYAPDLLALIYR